jgi:hypothetical protein
MREHHCFLLGQHLRTIEQLEETIAAFDARIEAKLTPFRGAIERLTRTPYTEDAGTQFSVRPRTDQCTRPSDARDDGGDGGPSILQVSRTDIVIIPRAEEDI